MLISAMGDRPLRLVTWVTGSDSTMDSIVHRLNIFCSAWKHVHTRLICHACMLIRSSAYGWILPKWFAFARLETRCTSLYHPNRYRLLACRPHLAIAINIPNPRGTPSLTQWDFKLRTSRKRRISAGLSLRIIFTKKKRLRTKCFWRYMLW